MENCSKNKHIFKPGQRKCICGKADIWYFKCIYCGANNTARNQGSACNDCQKDPKYQKKLKKELEQLNGVGIKFCGKYREPVAFMKDKKTGHEMAIDRKGRKFEVSETRYNFNRDPYGWKATGKKPRSKDKYNRIVTR